MGRRDPYLKLKQRKQKNTKRLLRQGQDDVSTNHCGYPVALTLCDDPKSTCLQRF